MSTGPVELVAGFLANNVQNFADEAGLTMEQLATRAGVHDKTVYNVRAGKVDARLSTIVLLAEALGRPPATLLRPPAGVLQERLDTERPRTRM